MVYHYLFAIVFSILVNYYFQVFSNFKANFVRGQNNSKFRDWAPLRGRNSQGQVDVLKIGLGSRVRVRVRMNYNTLNQWDLFMG